MRHQLTPTFSPDGFGGHAAAQSQREAGKGAVATAPRPEPVRDHDDRYDEGLVHSHGWAMSSNIR
ncbi:hypothetical protein [Acidocella sp.]|uniref:hypothetical protein n=1 Tax=Acidocella sp. TaxID=50710 RepID=UPI002614DCD2|nr:hypothetical protein [Acidocella sp.]